MSFKFLKKTTALAAIFMAATCFAQQKEIVVYTALEDDELAVYTKDWAEKNPDIKLKIVRDSTGIVTAKLLAEKANPQADVVWGTAATSLLLCDQNGMLEPYAPAGVEKIKPEFKDAKNKVPHWVGIKAWMTAVVCNTIEMDKLKLPYPQTMDDLLNPKYKGLITMPNPASSGTGFLTVSAVLQMKGEKAGWEYLDKLNDNIAFYTHSGSKPAKLAGKGECVMGISFDYRGVKQKLSGEPVKTVFPKDGSGWDLEANALIKKKDIKPEAKKFLDWAISAGMMKMYSKYYPVVANGEIPEIKDSDYPKDPVKQLIKNDFDWAAANREKILTEWTKRYDSKSEPKK